MDVSRRDFVKLAGIAAVGAAVGGISKTEAARKSELISRQAPVVGSKNVAGNRINGSTAKVYFTQKIDSKSLIDLYQRVNDAIYGKVAIKLHTGEKNGPNILPRDMVRAFQAQVPNSAIVECNTLYTGSRYTTEDHRETL